MILAQEVAAAAEATSAAPELSPVDYGAIAGYVLLMIVVGILCRNISANLSDYVRMGGKSTWWMAGLSVFMMSFSCATFTGYAAQAYLAGWSFMLNYAMVALMFFIQAAIFAPWMRNTRAVTPLDAIRLRFGPTIEQLVVYLSLSGAFVWSGFFLLTLAVFTSTVFGLPIVPVILVVGVVLVFYSVLGGSWSVQITDSLQSFLMLPILVVMAVLALHHIGGIGGLFEQIEAQGLSADFALLKSTSHEYTAATSKIKPMFFTLPWLAASLMMIFMNSANMTSCYRYLSIKTGRDARKAALLAGILTLVGACVWGLPAMVGRLSFSADVEALALKAPADGAYAVAAMKLLPPGLLGLVVVAMFAATMSSMDSNLTGTAGLLAKNLYLPLVRFLGRFAATMRSMDSKLTGKAGLLAKNLYLPLARFLGRFLNVKPLEGRKLLVLVKVINLLLGFWAIGAALLFSKYGGRVGIFGVMQDILALIGLPLGVPFVVSFLMRRIPKWAPVVGLSTGIMASVTMKFFGADIFGRTPYWHEIVFVITAASLIPTILTRFFWSTADQEYRKRVDHFFRIVRTPVDVEKEIGQEVDHSQLKTVGGLGLIMAVFLFPLVFFAGDLKGVLAVLAIFGFVLLVSGLMYLKGRKAASLAEEVDAKRVTGGEKNL